MWIVVGAATAGFVQGLTGFGFGLVAMSFWAWVLDPKLAAVLAVFGALTGQVLAAFTVGRGLDWKLVGPFVLGGLVGLPIGLWLLPQLDAVGFRAGIGALLALWCTLKGMERDAQRAVIQNFNLAMLATTMATYLASGIVTKPMLPLMATVAPALALPALLGMKVYVGISPQAFRQVVLTLLTASGLAMLASALPQLL